MAAGTLAFSLLHSVLASTAAKQAAGRLVGSQQRDAYYRILYNVQALASLALLLRYGCRLPQSTLYRVGGPAGWFLRGAQAAGVVWAVWAASAVGLRRLAGIDSLAARLRGDPIPIGPAAQGPERTDNGALTIRGPFRWSRHPLNLAPLPIFWLTPRLTTRRLAFNLVATAYLLLGSIHEERRLSRLYGPQYEAYRKSGVPFYWPLSAKWRRSASARLQRRLDRT